MFSFNQEDKPKIKLSPGPASLIVTRIYDTAKDGSPLRSKNGNLQIKLGLKATDQYGVSDFLYDYIPLIKSMQWKAKAIAECFGMPQAYSGDTLHAALLLNRDGRGLLKIDESPGYDPKIVVESYISAVAPARATVLETPPGYTMPDITFPPVDFDDEIPF